MATDANSCQCSEGKSHDQGALADFTQAKLVNGRAGYLDGKLELKIWTWKAISVHSDFIPWKVLSREELGPSREDALIYFLSQSSDAYCSLPSFSTRIIFHYPF